jgi:two-component system NarL family sensor kinase
MINFKFNARNRWLLIVCMFMQMAAQAQQHLADSVQKILQQQIPDSTRAYNMVMLAMYTEPLDMKKAHAIYKEAVEFSLSKKMNYYAGFALRYQATPYHESGQRDKELSNLQQAISLLEESDHPKAPAELASCYGNMSNYYRMIENFDSAVYYSLKSISIQEKLQNHKRLVTACLNLSMIYQQLKMWDKQKEYVDKGLHYAQITKAPGDLMLSYAQLASHYTGIRDFPEAKKAMDTATLYFNEKTMDFSRQQNFYLLKAGTFQNVKEYDSAVYYFEKSFENAKRNNSRWNMVEPLLQIGYVRLQQKKYADAERHLKNALQMAEADSLKVFMKEAYESLSDVFAASGRYREAYQSLGKFNALQNEILGEERKKFSLDLEKKYESEKKENQIKQLEAEKKMQHFKIQQKNTFNAALLGAAGTLIIISLLLVRNHRTRQKLQQQRIAELETEKQLAAIEAVLKGEEQERTRLAKDLHDGLGGMLSGIKYSLHTMKGNLIMTPENAQAFERSMDMLDSSIQEMRRVAQNLMPEALVKFGLDTALRDFCHDINRSGALKVTYQSIGLEHAVIEQTTAITIYRIVQELLNNILKHAAAQTAIVQVSRIDKTMTVTVEDDGKGFDTAILKGVKGIGWSNIQHRIEFLKGKLDIRSAAGKGTSVNIEITT